MFFKASQQESKNKQIEPEKDELLEKDSRFYINSDGEYSFKEDEEDLQEDN